MERSTTERSNSTPPLMHIGTGCSCRYFLLYLGIVLYRYLIATFGWVRTFKITDYLTIIAAVIGIINLSLPLMFISRILFGIVTGINTILIPTYLTSVLPGSMGGPAGTLNQLFITIGIFVGYWVGFLVVGDEISYFGWRLVIGLPILPAIIRLHTAENVYPYLESYLAIKQLRA